MAIEPSHTEIAARAYALFQQRGGQHGQDMADWLQAEAELRQLSNPPTPVAQETMPKSAKTVRAKRPTKRAA